MPTDEEWKAFISGAPQPIMVDAVSYRLRFNSFSMPVLLRCSDKLEYVVKPATSAEVTRAICSDQIMGHIAATIGAPVPPVRLVNISDELLKITPQMIGISSGIAHGSRYMNNASKDRMGIQFHDLPQNRSRFALLSIMYGLAGVDGDHQFFYEDNTKHVWSFDHGHFFHQGPSWTLDSLKKTPAAAPDAQITSTCGLVSDELKEAAKNLIALVNDAIAMAVASPQAAWKIMLEERVALAEHFRTRADALAV